MESKQVPEALTLDIGPSSPSRPQRARSIEDLFEDHFDAVYRYLSRRIGNAEDAKDLAAETFAAAMSGRCPRGVAPRCWLYGIARRKLADVYRKSRRHEPLDPNQADPSNLESSVALRRSIEALPSNQRDAFLLQALEDLSVDEIAQVMRRSRTSVKALLQRAKETLRKDHNDFLQVPDARK
ncbi:MAG: RNA polymerase sigma factor [Armatimonadetes bacterium]|nr:RNA polymerase sigma factor [Armatimonadota bacterium]